MKMKTIYNIKKLLFLMMVTLISGCDLTESNINPNSPTEVPPNVMLPYIEESIARLSCGTSQVCTGIFMQYYTGIDNHPIQVQQYILNEALYVDWIWNDYYDGPMINLKIMINQAEKEGSFYYVGIGKILLAMCLGNLTSLYGDIPYAEALEGSLNSHPKFDAQKDIYTAIQQLLDNGIAELGKSYVGKKPGSDDIIFNGNISKWMENAYALKARYYMHLTKRADEVGYNPSQKALEAVAKAMKSSDADMFYPFGFNAAEYNPFYSFTLLNYIVPNLFFTNLMLQLNDPRRSFYYKKKFGEATLNGLFLTSSSSPVFLSTYHELKLTEAEALLRINAGDPKAQTALQEGVKASIKRITGSSTSDATIASYLDANAKLTGNLNNDLKTIVTQKYVALFSSIESWTNYRRTGIPELVPNINGDHNQNPGGGIPRRFAYPQTERLYNKNFPAKIPTLQEKIWLDK